MATYSTADWATRALRKAGLADANEQPDASDQKLAVETAGLVFEDLAEEQIGIPNSSVDGIASPYMVQLTALLAIELESWFGLSSVAQSEAAKDVIYRKLRRMTASNPTGEVQRATYF